VNLRPAAGGPDLRALGGWAAALAVVAIITVSGPLPAMAGALTSSRGTGPGQSVGGEAGTALSPSLALFAVGVGAAVALLSLVFGPAPLLVGVLPFAWGAADWLRRASAELDAQEPRARAMTESAGRRDTTVAR